MKRKVFSSFLFAALLGMGSVGVVSCADYDSDINNLQVQVTENTKLTEALENRVNGMETQIKALQDALNGIKSCQCGDIDARIADQIAKALLGLNYTTPEDVAAAIKNALDGLNTGLTAEEVQALIDAYHAAHPGCQCGDIQTLIENYLKENPGLTEADVEAIVKAYHDAHPSSSLTENDVKSIVETYISQLQHFTKEEIEGMINTAIAQALANFVSCNCDSYTKSQVDALIETAIKNYAATDGHGLTAEEVQKLIDEAIAKIKHPESGISATEAEALVAKAITDALKDATKGLATEEYVKDLVEEAKCNCPALTEEDVASIASTVIEKYMEDHPYTLDTEAVKNIANTAIENSQIINNIRQSITTLQTTVNEVKAALENVYTKDQVYTKAEVEALIRSLIQQSVKNCDCDNTAISPEQQATIEQLISAAIEAYNNAHPDCNCQYDATAFANLVQQVADNTAAIAGIVIPDVSNFITNSELQQAINEVKALIPAAPDLSNYVTVAYLTEQINNVNLAIAAAEGKAQNALDKANEAYGMAEANAAAISNLQTAVGELNELYLNLSIQLNETTRKAEIAFNRSLSNYFEIETLKNLYNQLVSKVEQLEDKGYDDTELKNELENIQQQLDNYATKAELNNAVNTLNESIEAAKSYAKQEADKAAADALKDAKKYTDIEIGKLKTLYENADIELQNQINTINNNITTINGRLDDLEADMENVKKSLNGLAKLITSIELQGTKNPAFGYYALPFGVTSNVLIAYYGKNEHDTYFPAIDDYDLVYAEEENWITEADYNRIGFNPTTWYNGDVMPGNTTIIGNEGNAGKLFLTVNPSSVDFSTTKFTLVNSLGEESPIKLGGLKPSTEKLMFGQTRSVTNSTNGFYEAPATLNEADLEAAKFPVRQQLTDALEDVAKKQLNVNLSNLAQAIYNQLNGALDAYAVQATWTDEIGATHTTTSKYGIAATAIKPLSYNTLYGMSFKLPTITPLSELNIDLKKYIDLSKFSKEFKEEDLGLNIKFDFADIWYEESDGCIYADIHVTEKNKHYVEEKFKLVSADGVYTDPHTGVTKTFAGYSSNKELAAFLAAMITTGADAYSTQLAQEFADNIQKLLDKINDITAPGGKLDQTVNSLLDKVQGMMNDALKATDPIIDQLNSVIGKLNMYLDNPNLRLQTHVMFEGTDGFFHPMSTAIGYPSKFAFDGGDGINLYINSYTGEFLVPAFKKFVAVTNVYKDGKNADTDPALMKALQHANSVEYFNEVIPGERYAVVFSPDKNVHGATYEIVLSALDFHGKISQRKYYVYVD